MSNSNSSTSTASLLGILVIALVAVFSQKCERITNEQIVQLENQVETMTNQRKSIIKAYENELKLKEKEKEDLKSQIQDLEEQNVKLQVDLDKFDKVQKMSLWTWILFWAVIIGMGGTLGYFIRRNLKAKEELDESQRSLDEGTQDLNARVQKIYGQKFEEMEIRLINTTKQLRQSKEEKEKIESELKTLQTVHEKLQVEHEQLSIKLEEIMEESKEKDEDIVTLSKELDKKKDPWESDFLG